MDVMSMNVCSGPGRTDRVAALSVRGPVWLSIPSHKNMPSTTGSGEPNTDLDATLPGFDVYQAYQRALADEEVSQPALLLFTPSRLLIQASRYPPLWRRFYLLRSSLHVPMVNLNTP